MELDGTKVLERLIRRYPLGVRRIKEFLDSVEVYIRFQKLAEDNYGFYFFGDLGFFIILNKKRSKNYRKLTLAHEIAHIFYHKEQEEIVRKYSFGKEEDRKLEKIIDNEAQRLCHDYPDFIERLYRNAINVSKERLSY